MVSPSGMPPRGYGWAVAADVIVIGGGVVGCACALALARRGAAVTLLEALPALGLQASGTNSGILHTGFDSTPGELETELILRAAQLRPALLAALGVPFRRTGAVLRPRDAAERETVTALAARARGNGVAVELLQDGTLVVPGEGITDPVAFTLALAAAAARPSAPVVLGAAVPRLRAGAGARRRAGPLSVGVQAAGRTYTGVVAVIAAGLGAGAVARMAGDTSFD